MKQSEILSDLKGMQHGFCNATDSGTVCQPILMNQVRSADALFLTEPPVSPPMADAFITQTPNLCLTVKTADCAPVLMADPTSGMVAAVHAGWRGACQGILENTVLQMIKNKPPCRHIAYKTRTKQVGKRPIASRSLRPETGRSAVHSRS